MIAAIATGGKQYLVASGDVIKVEKLDQEVGQTVSLNVLMTAEGEVVQLGKPFLDAQAKAEIIEQGRAPKIEVVKYKAKSRYTRRTGHRQPFTKIKITSLG